MSFVNKGPVCDRLCPTVSAVFRRTHLDELASEIDAHQCGVGGRGGQPSQCHHQQQQHTGYTSDEVTHG